MNPPIEKLPSSLLLLSETSPSGKEDHREEQTRRRVHVLLSENFELRERVEAQSAELKRGEAERAELKERVRMLLDELAASDRIVESLKQHEHQLEHELSELSLKNEELAKTEGLTGHINSLETEIELLGGIKEKYMVELGRSRSEIELLCQEREALQDKNAELLDKTTVLLEEIHSLEEQVQAGRKQLHQYQQFVLSRVEENTALPSPPVSPGVHTSVQGSKLYQRYQKYKQRAHRYREERDRLLRQMGRVYREMDCSTLRQYYSERESGR